MTSHTVEKIGGTSMSDFEKTLNNIILKDKEDIYNRIFVVSAYAGITDMLLEHKKTSEPGVYGLFSNGNDSWAWGDAITSVGARMCEINASFEHLGLDLQLADRFVKERIEGVRSCLIDLTRLCSFGNFQLVEHLSAIREMLSALGEAHSAHNSFLILKNMGINSRFVDLTGWMEGENMGFDEKIKCFFKEMDLSSELPIATGYTRCKEGIMDTYDRGYSEITFSKIACVTNALEGIIHKEFHLSSGDPKVVGEDKVRTIGKTNYDVADQLSDLGMEAIHPRAAKGLRQLGIPLRIKNTFEPNHPGTLIRGDYKSSESRVEIIAGRPSLYGVEVFDQDTVGQYDRDFIVTELFKNSKIRYVAKNLNANTITHYVTASLEKINKLINGIEEKYPSAEVSVKKVAMVSAIGSNMSIPGFLAAAAKALYEKGINVLAVHQSMRQVDMQFIVNEKDFDKAVLVLHRELIEKTDEYKSQTQK
ncbi:MAG: aspartate kinase [Desulforegulaceae bacterium]|nr:aspartate kinase [Desulforegulaceae bacterium]